MTVTLVNVPNVPLVSTGTYQLASGEQTFSEEDLAAAVQAANDPSVPAPRLKIGHTDPRFNTDLDGEPAFGTVQNMRLSDDGQTIVGDYTDVPDWLAATMQSSYPGRSIEGGRGYVAPSGRKHDLVISNVALLGTTVPGVTSLADLREVLERNGTVAASLAESSDDTIMAATTTRAWSGSPSRFTDSQYAASCILDRAKCSDSWKNRAAKQRYSLPIREPNGDLNANAVHAAAQRLSQVQACPAAITAAKAALRSAYSTLGETPPDSIKASAAEITAGIDLGAVRGLFVKDLDEHRVPVLAESADQDSWWARSIRHEDNGLCLIVDDDAGHLIRLPFTENDGSLAYGDPEMVVQNFLPVAASASQDGQRVLASWPIRAASRPSTTPEVTTMDVDTAVLRKRLGLAEDADEAAILQALNEESRNPQNTEDHKTDHQADQPKTVVPEGMTLVDSETWESVREGAEQGLAVAAKLAQDDRDRTIEAAIKDGKFSAARREHYEQLWASDEQGARDTIASLATGLVPVQAREIGSAADGNGQSIEAQHANDMAALFPRESAQLHAKFGSRIHQEA